VGRHHRAGPAHRQTLGGRGALAVRRKQHIRDRLDAIEHFFVSYTEMEGKQFRPIGRHGAGTAEELVARARLRKGKAKAK
jgi:hypothetical protein